MSIPEPYNRVQGVRCMFDRISPRYDLLNRLMTLGQDNKWRSDAIRMLHCEGRRWVLDLGTGTGDLAFETIRQCPNLNVVAVDFAPSMLQIGRQRQPEEAIHWVIADATKLPFRKDSFCGITYAFLLRNVVDLEKSLQEQYRTLMSGGNIVCLETTPPRPGLLKPLITFYLDVIISLLGKWFADDVEAYQYLRDSTHAFLDAEELADRFRVNGFHAVSFLFRMLQTIAIHTATKPPRT